MSTFTRPVFAAITTFALAALTFASGCAVDAGETDATAPDAAQVASHDQQRDPMARVRPLDLDARDPMARVRPLELEGRDAIDPRLHAPPTLGNVVIDESTPALIELRDQCKREGRHWSLAKHVCMPQGSVEALTDACVFDGGVMTEGGCTFGGPAKPPTALPPAQVPAPTPPSAEVVGAAPKAPVVLGCVKLPCE